MVTLSDLLPPEFMRRSDESALRRPLLRREHDGLKYLAVLKPALFSDLDTLVQHQLIDLGVRTQVRE